jgi:hypothetical protein
MTVVVLRRRQEGKEAKRDREAKKDRNQVLLVGISVSMWLA